MSSLLRIRIFQPIVPEYRVQLFEGVAERYGDRIEVWAASEYGGDKSFPMDKMKHDYGHKLVRLGPFAWQRGLSIHGLKEGDIIVICGDLHQLSSLWIAIKAKFFGIKVIWWGHHKTATSRRIGIFIRLAIAKLLSDAYLCYTQTGKDWLLEHGFKGKRVFATGNTINQEPILKACSFWCVDRLLKWQIDHKLEGKNILLCCSVLRKKVHLELLIKAISMRAMPSNVVLAIIGDGEMGTEWRNLARTLKVDSQILWVGAMRDQESLAPWFLSAKLFVYPGAIGLGILHAFSYGVPVITHSNENHQMPEFEAMVDGETGLTYQEGNVSELAEKINYLLDNENLRLTMANAAKRVAYEKYTMRQMVANFCRPIQSLAER